MSKKEEARVTIGELQKRLRQDDKEQVDTIANALKVICGKLRNKVTIHYEDIDEKMVFVVAPITVRLEAELEVLNFKGDIEKDKWLISNLVKTEDGVPISFNDVDYMPFGMRKTLIAAINQLSFSHQTGEELLTD